MTDELDYAEAWKPEPGDVLRGRVEMIEAVNTAYADNVPVVTVANDDERWSVWCSRTVLRSEMERQAPNVGDEIEVTYLGVPEGKEYHRYRVRNISNPPKFRWGGNTAPRDEVPEADRALTVREAIESKPDTDLEPF